MSRLVLASNRLPVTLVDGLDGPTLVPSSGGLATALGRLHERTEGLWVGWPGELGRATAAARRQIGQALDARRLVPVPMTSAEVAQYYDGFSNGVLWPLFHFLLDKVDLDAEAAFRTYDRVNRRFAEKIAEVYRPGDVVWVHDYQLMLVPGYLRALVPGARIGFFLHIPFPAADVFRILPWREEVLRSLLAADLLGFHTASYRHNFAHATAHVLGVDLALEEVVVDDRTVRLGVFPIGIETAAFEETASSDGVRARLDALRTQAGGKRIVLGVDRLDYTKGIPRRLLTFERMLAHDPSLRDTVRFVQIAVPSREKVSAYAELRRTVNELAGRINAEHGTPLSMPLQLLYRSVSFDELVALYRAADVMLVTPLRDGMNLVAKEYVASRIDDDGVLVLSEFAGAAAELREAVLVNPYDLEGTAAALAGALAMPEEERRSRMRALRAHVRTADVHVWAQGFVDALTVDRARATPVGPTPEAELAQVIDTLRASDRLVVLLDYDGTLVPHVAMPDLATPDAALKHLLTRLATRASVHVVSGRDRLTLERWLGELPVALHAEHGYWSRPLGAEWQANRHELSSWKDIVRPVLEAWIKRTPGAFLEEKTVSLAAHFRNVEPAILGLRLAALREELRARLPDAVEILDGAKVLELRLRGVHKGLVADALVREAGAVLAVGDDRTDEDLFAALGPDAVTIKVGSGETHARFSVPTVADARRWLTVLAG
ncbi:MAG: bifunctional alpha,alpha-trehalose-phosphate synthase (UDP-forming)/trehalose-phosphatase [Sandaracinaceae bacterium]